MHSEDKFQEPLDAPSPNIGQPQTPLSERYDHLRERWFRIDSAIRSGAINEVTPTFRIGRRRIYARAQLDERLAEMKFGPMLERARAHRGDASATLPMHLSPPVPQPGRLPFARAYQLAWQEHHALARLNKPQKKKRPKAAPPIQWALEYSVDDDGEFALTGGIAQTDGER